MIIASWIFGALATLSLFVAYQQKQRKGLLFCKLSADGCWAIHYFCLGAYAGMIPNFVGMIRETIFLKRKNNSAFNSAFLPILFVGLNWALGFFAYQSPMSLLPIAASTLVTLSLWLNNPKITKLLSLPVSATFIVYDLSVSSYIGVFNECVCIFSIILYFIQNKGDNKMNETMRQPALIEGGEIQNPQAVFSVNVDALCLKKGKAFSKEITDRFLSDFEKSDELVQQGKADKKDLMAHVSTFADVGKELFVTYYANQYNPNESPEHQTARLVCCPIDDLNDKQFFDVQTVGDEYNGKKITMVYDTILFPKDENEIYVLWTARLEDVYYRFYRIFNIKSKTFGEVKANLFKVGNITNEFSIVGIKSALAENGIGIKTTYSDIGIMQKLSTRIENGETYYYTGAYSGDFNCIIKSKDFITWEYVSQPDFVNLSKWENAVYVLGDILYYFVRQNEKTPYGFLTTYNLITGKWATPVLIEDNQSRSDFIYYRNKLYLFHAPIDRTHIGVVEINTDNIAQSKQILQAKMDTGCFYPFVQYYLDGELAMSYTVDRKHIRMARFNLSNYI